MFHVKCATEFKTCYRLWFGPLKSALILCHPDTIKVIQSSNAPKERFVCNLVRPFIGKCCLVELTVDRGRQLLLYKTVNGLSPGPSCSKHG